LEKGGLTSPEQAISLHDSPVASVEMLRDPFGGPARGWPVRRARLALLLTPAPGG